jgi:hypothetical protein
VAVPLRFEHRPWVLPAPTAFGHLIDFSTFTELRCRAGCQPRAPVAPHTAIARTGFDPAAPAPLRSAAASSDARRPRDGFPGSGPRHVRSTYGLAPG